MSIAILAYMSLNEQQYLQTKMCQMGLMLFAIQEVLFRHFMNQQTAKMEQQWYKERGTVNKTKINIESSEIENEKKEPYVFPF